jgi:hypothetical protein
VKTILSGLMTNMDDRLMNLSCFMAYDICGKVPQELNEELACKLAWLM